MNHARTIIAAHTNMPQNSHQLARLAPTTSTTSTSIHSVPTAAARADHFFLALSQKPT
jgi:hypothetical protein